MNMQTTAWETVVAAQNRADELQNVILRTTDTIQSVYVGHAERQMVAKSRRMTPAEFLILYPDAPVDGDFAEENAELATLQAEYDAITWPQPDPCYTISGRRSFLEQRIEALKKRKSTLTARYHTNKLKPDRCLTDAEYTALYPKPTDADFIDELAAIEAARVEINLLDQFLKSGPAPNTGLYDVDFLTGTAISV